MVAYLEDKQIPVLHNEMAAQLTKEGHSLNLLDDKQFVEQYQQKGQLYAVSENALVWLYAQMPHSELVKKVKILKDKAAFRRICQQIYPDFYYKEVEMKTLRSLNPDELPLPSC